MPRTGPLPPDMRPYLPRIRQLLLEGKPDEANTLVDEAQKKAGFDKYMNFDNRILYPEAGPRRHTAFTLTFRPFERTNDLRLVHPSNALAPMDVTESGMMTSFKDPQPLYASAEMDVVPSAIRADEIRMQPWNVPTPILGTSPSYTTSDSFSKL